MESAVTAESSKAGNTDDGAKRRQRRPKTGNSDLFNDLLSAANGLSVSERTRLVKSLAGQLGLVTVGGQSLIDRPAEAGVSKKTKKEKSEAPPVRPNPLKNTKFWMDKEAAKAAMLKAREDAGGVKLPPDNPAVTAYNAALKAYKDEQAKLKPVEPSKEGAQSGTTSKKSSTKKRAASQSPVRSGSTSLLAKAQQAAKQFTGGSRSSSSKDVKMAEE